ncbi:septum site-determining protein MinC [Endozoicomonas arenosclerae]|uniref:septum site-determining protein MinC n=1 Tax=Endozoicomonas arenosclerae TaxID=1633495 RepID=UPI0007851A1B|nr:septum site-determining protein MinC [Endozoicomonas arenosclerae]
MNSTLTSKQQTAAFQLKGGIYTLTTLELHNSCLSSLSQQLQAMSEKAPHFFQQTPVVLALEKLPSAMAAPDLIAVSERLKQSGMMLVAVRGNEQYKLSAERAGIAWLPSQKPRSEKNVVMMKQSSQQVPVESLEPSEASAGAEGGSKLNSETSASETRIIEQPVRSGQQIYAPGDLVVLSQVSPGAELLAGGHIHVYGPLRGRALAGVNGNTQARIFCHRFEAELISISGQYKLTSQAEGSTWSRHWGKSVLIKLAADHLHISRL